MVAVGRGEVESIEYVDRRSRAGSFMSVEAGMRPFYIESGRSMVARKVHKCRKKHDNSRGPLVVALALRARLSEIDMVNCKNVKSTG